MEIRLVEAVVWMGNGPLGPDDVATDEGIAAAIHR